MCGLGGGVRVAAARERRRTRTGEGETSGGSAFTWTASSDDGPGEVRYDLSKVGHLGIVSASPWMWLGGLMGLAIDATGLLVDGTKLDGPLTLRRALLDLLDQADHESMTVGAVARSATGCSSPSTRRGRTRTRTERRRSRGGGTRFLRSRFRSRPPRRALAARRSSTASGRRGGRRRRG